MKEGQRFNKYIVKEGTVSKRKGADSEKEDVKLAKRETGIFSSFSYKHRNHLKRI